MADPLSIAAGAAGLLSLAIQVTDRLIKYYNDFKTQNIEVSRTLKDIQSMQILLQEMNRVLNQRRFSTDERDIIDNIETCLNDCQELIRGLESELLTFQTTPAQGPLSKIEAIGRKAAYPFRISTLSKIGGQAREIKETISLGLAILQQKDQQTIMSESAALTRLVKSIRNDQISSQLREWLRAPDVSVDHNSMVAKRHGSTGAWFIRSQEFEEWLDGDTACLWLHGFAGCGKSVLFSTAVQHTLRRISSTHRDAIAYFYFSYSDESRKDASALLRSLVLQLALQLYDGQQQLDKLKQRHNFANPTNETLMAIMEQLVEQFDNVFLLVDALDECPRGHQRNQLLEAINRIRSWGSFRTHVLLTSRHEPDIDSFLNSGTAPVSLNLSQSTFVGTDVKTFVEGQLKDHPRLQKHKKFKNQIKDALFGKAGENFRWAECHLRILDQCPANSSRINKCLNALPQTLDDTYTRILDNIDDAFADDARRILLVLCAMQRPLLLEELIDAIAIDLDAGHFDAAARYETFEDLNEICPGFLCLDTVSTYSDMYWSWFRHLPQGDEMELQVVRFAHFSIQEYLTSERIRSSKAAKFHLKASSVQDEMASLLLTYLLDDSMLAKRKDLVSLDNCALLHLATSSWFRYLFDSGENPGQAETLALNFFQSTDNFRSWIEFFNPKAWQLAQSTDSTISHTKSQSLREVTSFHQLYYASLLGLTSLLETLMKQESKEDLELLLDEQDLSMGYGNCVRAAAQMGHYKIVTILTKQRKNDLSAAELTRAATNGDTEVIKALLAGGLAPNIPYGQTTPLHRAASRGHTQVVEILLDAGVDANLPNEDGRTALEEAVQQNHASMVRLLCERGAAVTHLAIIRAINHDFKDLLYQLIQAGADVDMKIVMLSTPLQYAAQKNKSDCVSILLEAGASVAVADSRRATPLHYAAFNGANDALQVLINAGAELDAQSEHGTALQVAAYSGQTCIMQTLLDAGANVNAIPGSKGTALQCGIWGGSSDDVGILLSAGANIYARGPAGNIWRYLMRRRDSIVDGEHTFRTCQQLIDAGGGVHMVRMSKSLLDWAINIHQSYRTLELLLVAGVNPNVRLRDGCTALEHVLNEQKVIREREKFCVVLLRHGAVLGDLEGLAGTLHRAVRTSDATIVSKLLEAGADVHSLATDGRGTLLQCAIQTGEWSYDAVKVVEVLISAGADVNACHNSTKPPLQMAIELAKFSEDGVRIVELLLEAGADVDNPCKMDGSGETALHTAIAAGATSGRCRRIIQLLLNAGTKINATSEDFGTPLQFAIEWFVHYANGDQIIKMMLDAGADINAPAGPYGSALQCALDSDGTSEAVLQILEVLVAAGANINEPFQPAGSALQSAIRNLDYDDSQSAYDVVKLLLDAGADTRSLEAVTSSLLSNDAASRVRELARQVDLNRENGSETGAQTYETQAIETQTIFGDLPTLATQGRLVLRHVNVRKRFIPY